VNNQTGNNQTDKHLVERVLSGDSHAFGVIIKNTEGLVAQIVYKMINNAEDRKDLAQDVYLKAFKGLPGFRYNAKLSTWIGQIAYNSCLSYLEKKKLVFPGDVLESNEADEGSAIFIGQPFAGGAGAGNSTETMIFQKELGSILRCVIEELSPIHKTLITLYHNEELTYEEIGLITGMPEGTVKNYLFRARRALKDRLLLKYKKEGL
jgi:RNA polymerase sigma factor (sigma-70 family)